MFKGLGKKVFKFMTKTLVGRVADKTVLGGALNNIATENRKEIGKLDIKEFVLDVAMSPLAIILVVSLLLHFKIVTQDQLEWLVDVFNIDL